MVDSAGAWIPRWVRTQAIVSGPLSAPLAVSSRRIAVMFLMVASVVLLGVDRGAVDCGSTASGPPAW